MTHSFPTRRSTDLSRDARRSDRHDPHQGCVSLPCRRTGASARLDQTDAPAELRAAGRSEEHTSELQSLMRISYAVFCLKKKHNTYADDALTAIYCLASKSRTHTRVVNSIHE